jgi:DNA-binding transcriptional regulator YhcF (GntR family)
MFAIDDASRVPPYEQLRVQVRNLVSSGELAAGARMPTVRQLATDLGLAPNTVARAYRELEADEIIESRGRQGTFVSAQGDAIGRQAQIAAREFADRVRQLGVAPSDALAWVEKALRD